MKRIWGLILLICLINIPFVSGQIAMPKTSDPTFYTVQIQALSRELPPNHFEGLSGVWMRKASDGLFKYYHGRYATENEARSAVATLRKKGFSDAFMVSSERFTIKSAPYKASAPKTKVAPAKPASKAVAISAKPVAKKAEPAVQKPSPREVIRPEDIKEGMVWTVQLSAFKYPVYLNFFDPLKNIMEFQGPDKYFKYCIGKYSDYDDAHRALEEYKEMGYDKAFVVDYEKYLPYLIE